MKLFSRQFLRPSDLFTIRPERRALPETPRPVNNLPYWTPSIKNQPHPSSPHSPVFTVTTQPVPPRPHPQQPRTSPTIYPQAILISPPRRWKITSSHPGPLPVFPYHSHLQARVYLPLSWTQRIRIFLSYILSFLILLIIFHLLVSIGFPLIHFWLSLLFAP